MILESDEGSVSFPTKEGMTINQGHYHALKSPINLNNDIIHLHFESNGDSTDNAVFRGIRLRFSNKKSGVIELFNSKNGFNDDNEKVKKY